MKKYILFSFPSDDILDKIKPYFFPKEIRNKNIALMWAEGQNREEDKFLPFWEKYFRKNNVDDFCLVDNSQTGKKAKLESAKLMKANILMICGGNTFGLLHNLRKSGLDKEIKKFAKRKKTVIAGFSAGALVLTPNINLAGSPAEESETGDENKVGLKNLKSLGLVDFEVYPHYEDKYLKYLENYKKETKNEVKTITDEEFILV